MKKRTFAVSRQGPRAFCKPGNVSQSSTADTRRAAVSCQVVFLLLSCTSTTRPQPNPARAPWQARGREAGTKHPTVFPPPPDIQLKTLDATLSVQGWYKRGAASEGSFLSSNRQLFTLLCSSFMETRKKTNVFVLPPKLWRRTIVDHLHASELKYEYDLILF